MNDINTENKTFNDCEYLDKYDKLPVTPAELYARQNGVCYLELAYDLIDGEETAGDLYCTDGTDYFPTKTLLNPTFECIVCMTKFSLQEVNSVLVKNKLDRLIVDILVALNQANELGEGKPSLYMSNFSFNKIEDHINSTTISSTETKPLKINRKGDILLFGYTVYLHEEINEDTIVIEPGNKIIKFCS